MPEGVEVRISAELIKPLVVNKIIQDIELSDNGRYSKAFPKGYLDFDKVIASSNIEVINVQVKGKFMYWTFSNGWYMFSTFGMTGQWSPEPGKHVCLEMKLIDYHEPISEKSRSNIYFNDPRHFGTILFTNNKAELTQKLRELGWDPLAHGMDDKWINNVSNTLAHSAKPIAQVLMDQGVFAGVGNYIRAEALYLAKMSPWRQANLLKKDEIRSLCQAIVDVMNESYKHQGATILTYKDAYGAEGKYSSCFKVYGQKTDPLGNPIKKEDTPDKRTIHWCPAVQS